MLHERENVRNGMKKSKYFTYSLNLLILTCHIRFELLLLLMPVRIIPNNKLQLGPCAKQECRSRAVCRKGML